MKASEKYALLKEQVRKAGEACNELTNGYLNAGGCAEFAATLAETLAQLGWKVGAVVGDDQAEPSLDTLRADMEPNNNNMQPASAWYAMGVSFHHVLAAVKLGRRWFMLDSENIQAFDPDSCENEDPTLGYPLRAGMLTWQEARLVYDTGSWNTLYRRAWTPAIRKIIRETVTVRA